MYVLMFFALTVLFFAPRLAYANVPLVPAGYLAGFTAFSIAKTSGLGFLIVILIEALVLQHREQIRFTESIKLSFFANILSTIIGVVLMMAYSSSFAIIIIGLPCVIIFTKMFRSLCKRSGFLEPFAASRTGLAVISIVFTIIIVFIIPILALLTIPGHYSPPRVDASLEFSSGSERVIAMLSAGVLLMTGFILSVISEGFLIIRHISKRTSNLIATVVYMNLVSYLMLFIISASFISTIIAEKSWFWHR